MQTLAVKGATMASALLELIPSHAKTYHILLKTVLLMNLDVHVARCCSHIHHICTSTPHTYTHSPSHLAARI